MIKASLIYIISAMSFVLWSYSLDFLLIVAAICPIQDSNFCAQIICCMTAANEVMATTEDDIKETAYPSRQ